MVTLKELKKGQKKDIPTHWKPFAHFAPHFAWVFHRLGLSPNGISVVWIVILFISITLYSLGNYTLSIIALIINMLAMVWDYSDGALARALNKKSQLGLFLDEFAHCFQIPLLYMAVAIGHYVNSGSHIVLLLGFITSFLYMEKTISRTILMDSKEQQRHKKLSERFIAKNKWGKYSFEIINPHSFSLFHIAVLTNQIFIFLVIATLYYTAIFLRNIRLRVNEKIKIDEGN